VRIEGGEIVRARRKLREIVNPLVPGSSPGGPTIYLPWLRCRRCCEEGIRRLRNLTDLLHCNTRIRSALIDLGPGAVELLSVASYGIYPRGMSARYWSGVVREPACSRIGGDSWPGVVIRVVVFAPTIDARVVNGSDQSSVCHTATASDR
jgi:hypothetical protein